jgi:hypothetical protein
MDIMGGFQTFAASAWDLPLIRESGHLKTAMPIRSTATSTKASNAQEVELANFEETGPKDTSHAPACHSFASPKSRRWSFYCDVFVNVGG